MALWNVKSECSGCGACAAVCPKNCIEMTADGEGFVYPVIREDLCVQCGACEKTCPILHPRKGGGEAPRAYAMVSKDDGIRQVSSSGGIFSLLADQVLEQGGAVFGAALTEDMTVCHICVEDPADLPRLRGSKYVQSRVGDTYRQAKALLGAGKPVLYTGTPCQIGGLRAYLGREYDNLICQDLICHGAPSPAVWQRYVAYREKIAGGKCRAAWFRHKGQGWQSYALRMEFDNGTVYEGPLGQDPYLRGFLKDLCLRPSCYSCAFKGQRQADLTLADYWGVWDQIPQLHDGGGTSLVLIHTEKGQQAFESICNHARWEPARTEQALAFNPAWIRSAPRPEKREQFMAEIETEDFEAVVNRYCPRPGPLKKLYQKGKRFIKKCLG